MAGADERALIAAAQAGSEAAVEELFRRHWPNTHRAAYLIVRDAAAAEDIAQEAFLSALSALGRFDRRRRFAPWLHRIAVNRAIDWSRARKARGEVAASDPLLDSAGSEPAAEEAVGSIGAIEAALAELSAEHRAAVVLRYLLDYTPGEIARMLDVPRGTINSRLRRALDRLSVLLKRSHEREAAARGAARRAGPRCEGRRGAWPAAGAGRVRRPRPPLRPRRRGRRWLQVAIAVGLLAALVSPAGAAVRHWVRDAVQPAHEPALPALTSLPAPGALLVDSPRGAWIVHEDGSKRLLGAYAQSTWSPHGLFVAATGPGQLLAVDPQGEVRWTVAHLGSVTGPAWSPDGYRVAYLNAGTLRVVAADGTGDRPLERRVAPATPAWRPGPHHLITFAERTGSVRTVDADSGASIFETQPGPLPTGLAWSRDGSRLLVVRRSGLSVLDRDGGLLWSRPAPSGMELGAATLTRDADRVAAVLSTRGSEQERAAPARAGRVHGKALRGPRALQRGPRLTRRGRGCCSPGRAPTSGSSSTSPTLNGSSRSPASRRSSIPAPPRRRPSPSSPAGAARRAASVAPFRPHGWEKEPRRT